MKRILIFLILLHNPLWSQYPTGESLLEQIDKNLSASNRVLTSRMIIQGRRDSRTIESRSWVQGTEKSFTEYLSPAREQGTRMLKLANQLWLYSPATDRIIQISGHMLRQSVMGSDLSYEDMMEDARLALNYQATVIGAEIIESRKCWVLALRAKTEDLAYHTRKLWVDSERLIPLKEELYAKSGKLLKKVELFDIQKAGDRWFPMRMRFKDILKTGGGTEFIITSIQFDQDIPEYIFSKAALKR